MENRNRSLFLKFAGIALLPCLMLAVSSVCAADATTSNQEQVIQPELERKEVDLSRIDTEDFEIGAFAGMMSVQDFDVNPVYGVRLGYHVNEMFFIEGALGATTVGQASIEQFVNLLTEDQRDLTYYNISLGYNVLPGEAFIGKKRAYNTALYLIGGIGSTDFAGDNYFTVNFGAGYRMLINDWIALHIDLRDHIFDTELLGEKKSTHNVEATVGFSFFF